MRNDPNGVGVVGVKAGNWAPILIMVILVLSLGAVPGSMNRSTVHAQASRAVLELWSDQYGSNARTPDGKLNITDLGLVAGSEFDVKVNVTGAGPINVFGLAITYDFYVLGSLSGVLDAVGAFLQGGLFDPDNPPPGCDIAVPVQRVDQPPGLILFTVGVTPASPLCPGTVDGTGTLLTITFKVLKEGSTTIEIIQTATSLVGIGETGSFSVPFTVASAYFRNKPGVPPVADFEVTSPALGVCCVSGDVIRFNATISFDPDNSTQGEDKGIRRFAWSFADGTFGSKPVEDHLFATVPGNFPISGNFSVTLVVWDFTSDLTASKTVVVNVQQRAIHDVALSISLSRSSLSAGDGLSVNVTVINRSTSDESINLVIYYDYQGKTILLEQSGISLTVAERRISRSVEIPTGPLSPRTYTVTAEGTIVNATGLVPDERPEDNTRTASFVILAALQSSFLSVPILIGIGLSVAVVVGALGYLLRRRHAES